MAGGGRGSVGFEDDANKVMISRGGMIWPFKVLAYWLG